jgi:hypothetical protein
MFFAPSRVTKRRDDWGRGGVESRIAEVWPAFLELVGQQVSITKSTSPEAVQQVWAELVEGTTPPNEAHVIQVT